MLRRRGRAAGTTPFPGFVDVTEIGGGGFATVYRAVEEATERPVALKALRVENLPSFVVEAFDQEMKALGAVSSHPNIVTLFRPLKTPERQAVLVLELCEESYAQRVRRTGPLPAAEAVSVGIKVAGALETAHQAGFLHRDVKPQNLLVTQYGEPALSDFGVAALRSSAQATEGVFGFTTLHASPEVLEGRALSPATDVYGLASSLYQLLSGAAPFAAFDGEAPAAVILRILSQPVAPLRDEAIPFELSRVLEEALAKNPAARPQSALALADRLRAVEAASGWAPTTPVIWQTAGRRPGAVRSWAADAPLARAGAASPPTNAGPLDREPAGVVGPTPEGGPGAAQERVLAGLPDRDGRDSGLEVPAASPLAIPAPAPHPADQGGTRTGLVMPASVPRRVVYPAAPDAEPAPEPARPAAASRDETEKPGSPRPTPPRFRDPPEVLAAVRPPTRKTLAPPTPPTPQPPPVAGVTEGAPPAPPPLSPPSRPAPRPVAAPAVELTAPKVAPIYTAGSAGARPDDSELESTVLPRLHPVAKPTAEADKDAPRRPRRLLPRRDQHNPKER